MKMALFLPELFLLLSCLVIFILTLGKSSSSTVRSITAALSVIAFLICVASLKLEGELFFKAYRIDLFSQFFKLAITGGLAVLLLFSKELKGINEDIRTEYYLFLLLSVLGLVMLVSSVELLSIFVALELSSYALYLMVPMRDDQGGLREQMEAGIKYILFGVVATGVMLFGMSYLFGLTGTTYLSELVPSMMQVIDSPAAIVGVAMVMGGFFFKLGLFPFHFWLPDVYQGASNETTAFIASVPKLGAVALLIRVATLAAPTADSLVSLLMILAACSMFYGNLIALVQKDIKRMLAFSGIAHAGYVILGIITLKDTGFATAIYYITGYMLMNLACFLVICNVSKSGENLNISDLTGLYKRAPLMAITLAVGMFALAGIPPFVGFMGKFMLLAYYYLSVVRVSYCTDPENRPAVQVGPLTQAVSIALVLIIIVMGIMPAAVVNMATLAVQGIM
jgi:NADH-quinone oxidoreductase subunit N